MLKFRSCPKCRGDMYCDIDEYGAFEECLQCGCIRDLSGAFSEETETDDKDRERVLVAASMKEMSRSFPSSHLRPGNGAGKSVSTVTSFLQTKTLPEHSFASDVAISELCLHCQSLQMDVFNPLGFSCHEQRCDNLKGHTDRSKPLLVCCLCNAEFRGTETCLDCNLMSHCECHGELLGTENCQGFF